MNNDTESKLLRIRPPRWIVLYLLVAVGLHYLSPEGTLLYVSFMLWGSILVVVGIGIMAWARLLFKKEDNEISPTSPSNKVLITRGPYRLSRNPMYLGSVLVLAGIAFFVGSIPMFFAPIALFITLNNIFIPYEEAKMERQFGRDYAAYRKQVRRWI